MFLNYRVRDGFGAGFGVTCAAADIAFLFLRIRIECGSFFFLSRIFPKIYIYKKYSSIMCIFQRDRQIGVARRVAIIYDDCPLEASMIRLILGYGNSVMFKRGIDAQSMLTLSCMKSSLGRQHID